uniref:Uncharacterized protein n=1 Tax=Ditylenchus dipsaci TaxID=166011 RepID=A0A915DAW6_9BILA
MALLSSSMKFRSYSRLKSPGGSMVKGGRSTAISARRSRPPLLSFQCERSRDPGEDFERLPADLLPTTFDH